MKDFQPELDVTMKARYADALNPIFNSIDLIEGTEKRPDMLRKHIFDFYDGIRIIIFRVQDLVVFTHYCVVVNEPMEFECVGQFIEFIIMHINTIKPEPIDGIVDAYPDGRRFHIVVSKEIANTHLN